MIDSDEIPETVSSLLETPRRGGLKLTTWAKRSDVAAWMDKLLPLELDGLHWMVAATEDYGTALVNRFDGTVALVSGRVESDGRRWVHVSLSLAGRLPSTERVVSLVETLAPGRVAWEAWGGPPYRANPTSRHFFFLPDGASPMPDFAAPGKTL